jgi:hypothetical protein
MVKPRMKLISKSGIVGIEVGKLNMLTRYKKQKAIPKSARFLSNKI